MMNELERIEEALTLGHLDSHLFEQCATDLLGEIYPGLSPVPGGADRGRDGDIHVGAGITPIRLVVTTSRTYQGVRENLKSGLESMVQNGLPVDRVVLANPASFRARQRELLDKLANEYGVVIESMFDVNYFKTALRTHGDWRQKLLGLSPVPITLSEEPIVLGMSEWSSLPLIGRDQELRDLGTRTGDLVIEGPPGIGKTRLISELENVVFVDHLADKDRLADDLRRIRPKILVLDDAGKAKDLLEYITRLRQVEPELLRFRAIAICWPDETRQVSLLLGGPEVMSIDLLEPGPIDQILLNMGITSIPARQEIIDQAEGRPGWAIALGDMLIKTRDPRKLLSGKSLLGQVNRYMTRAGIEDNSVHLLAVISAVGGVNENELTKVGSVLAISRIEVAETISKCAVRGLIDVGQEYDYDLKQPMRRYSVRPPMLAKALVAEKCFADPAPSIDLSEIARVWPERVVEVAEATIDCVLLGHPEAIPVARQLYAECTSIIDIPDHVKTNLTRKYCLIDEQAGNETIDKIKEQYQVMLARPGVQAYEFEPLVEIACHVARRHMNPDAIKFLLDVALVDSRRPSSNPGQPLRQIEDMVQGFQPNSDPVFEYREMIINATTDWLRSAPESDERWSIYGSVCALVLSFRCSSSYLLPGDPRTGQFLHGVVSTQTMNRIYEELWPRIRTEIDSAPDFVLANLVDVCSGWLRNLYMEKEIGLSKATLDAIRRLGRNLARELVEITRRSIGATARLKTVVSNNKLRIAVPQAGIDKVFLADIDRFEDLEGSERRLFDRINQYARRWTKGSMDEVLDTILNLKVQLRTAGINWPDRIGYACLKLSQNVADPVSWIRPMLEKGLASEVGYFVNEAVQKGQELSLEMAKECLRLPDSRWAIINATLLSDADGDQLNLVLRNLSPSDYRIFQSLFVREALTASRISDLLCRTSNPTRGAVAAAMFTGSDRSSEWNPGAFEGAWLEALLHLEEESTVGLDDYELRRLYEYLAEHYPEEVVAFVINRISESEEGIYSAIPHSIWETLHKLPPMSKESLWTKFEGNDYARDWLAKYIVGEDVNWLRKMVESEQMTVDEALDSYDGRGNDPALEDLARILIPKGVAPNRIAWLARLGGWTGKLSDCYSELVERFKGMMESEDENIRALGEAGVDLYSKERSSQLQKEKKSRIRGEI